MPELNLIDSGAIWTGFIALVLVLLALDLFFLNAKTVAPTFKAALWGCIFWIGIGLAFNLGVYFLLGAGPALQFFTGYLIEKSLSVDNLFVFLIIFSYFKVPESLQRRVLFFGILGALLMRGVFIFLGLELLAAIHWMTEALGLLLVVSGVKLMVKNETEYQPNKNPVVKIFRRFVPITSEYHKDKFIIRKQGKLWATPLLLVLVAVEFTDLLFAIDSVPAIFAITSDPFIIYSSNVFAILGLRSLFFLVNHALRGLAYLNYGLALVLVFVGVKMLTDQYFKIPTHVSLLIISLCLGSTVIISIMRKPGEETLRK